MSWTYDLTSTDESVVIISKLRIAIGDEQEGAGVKPNGDNFADQELTHFYEEEGDHIGRATALACESLANAWSRAPRTMFGSLVDPRHITKNYERRAKDLRRQHGYARENESNASFSIGMRQQQTS